VGSPLANENEDLRREIARLARDKKRRIVPNSPKIPCVWQPLTVTNPESDLPFTSERAWQFIAELIEAGHPIQEVTLEKPMGDTAYVMEVELAPNTTLLYIKVQLKGGQILGRSFHYSTK
jgi:hypothetical protein